jgi:hypothetical protein
MCTVTIVRVGGMLRIACNRDERRERAAAHPPFIATAGRLQIIAPQDPQGGGTWFAVNSAGMVFALLNAEGTRPRAAPCRSRGLVIPAVAHAASFAEVSRAFDHIELAGLAPFRLLAVHDHGALEIVAGEAGRSVRRHAVSQPLLFTSSSLGDALVEGPRRALFDQMLRAPAADPAAHQDAFHAHRWRDRPAVSVHMSRPDACTVSTAIAEVTARTVCMTYLPAHDSAGTHVGLAIHRQDTANDAAHWPCGEHAAV